MKDITHHPQDPAALDLLTAQPATCPDHHVVGQRAKQHQHVSRLKALLVAFGEARPLLAALEGGFDASPALIVERHIIVRARFASSSCKVVLVASTKGCKAEINWTLSANRRSTTTSTTEWKASGPVASRGGGIARPRTPLGAKGGFRAARQSTHINIQQLKTGFVVVPVPSTVLPVDPIQRMLYLSDMLTRTCIQRLLHDRLLCTRLVPKGVLQSRISTQVN